MKPPKVFFIPLVSFWTSILTAQSSPANYIIDAQLNPSEKTVTVSQTLTFTNPSSKCTNVVYLYDWINSYSETQTPLSSRITEELGRDFYFSGKSKWGETNIVFIREIDAPLAWSRLEDQPDLIQLFLNKSLEPNESITIYLNYQIKIPDQRFTGFGAEDNSGFILRHWHIALAPYIDGKWILNSNLDIGDNSLLPSDFKTKWKYPSDYFLASNLNEIQTVNTGEKINTSMFEGFSETKAQFVFSLEDKFKKVDLGNGRTIVTDFQSNSISDEQLQITLRRIDEFTSKTLLPFPHDKLLILRLDYDKNPYYGLSKLSSFLSMFSDSFHYEIKFYKAYLLNYLNEHLPIDKRKSHWVIGGLQTYMMMKYVETFYPNEKFLGRIANFKLLKSYYASTLPFNYGYRFFYEISEHANLQQPSFETKDRLTRFNEKIASPYHAGLGLSYLDTYIGGEEFVKGVKNYISNASTKSLKQSVSENTDKEVNWFFDDFLKDRRAFDLAIKNVKKQKDSICFTVSEKNGRSLPFVLGLVKNDSLVYKEWLWLRDRDTTITLPQREAEYLAINPNANFPESKKSNNWVYLNNKLGLNPLKIFFFKDIKDPRTEQLFYLPTLNFNAYDGLMVGMNLSNNKIKLQPFQFTVVPQYGFLGKSLVGSFSSVYQLRSDTKKNYLTQFSLYGSSFHYNKNLRYSTIIPSLSFFFRTPDFRSNKQEKISLSWYNVYREKASSIKTHPDYSVLNLSYLHSNKNTINYLTAKSDIEFSNSFGKFYFSLDYRKLFPNGRQFSFRFFMGKFLWHNSLDSTYFDFNLNRPTDYLFRYDYLGWSETTGIFSQQLVVAEGGFKSKFDQSISNDYLISTNFSMGIWKWIEVYSDLGVLKNRKQYVRGYFDSGIRLNLLPDYFELYFPIASSNGWEIAPAQYPSKIRFVFFSLNLQAIVSLFNQRWF